MITLYRRRDSREADEIQEALEELVLAHEVVDVDATGTTSPGRIISIRSNAPPVRLRPRSARTGP